MVRQVAASAANTKAHGAPFRHMLFYGPPGTGGAAGCAVCVWGGGLRLGNAERHCTVAGRAGLPIPTAHIC